MQKLDYWNRMVELPERIELSGVPVHGVSGGVFSFGVADPRENAAALDALALAMRGRLPVSVEVRFGGERGRSVRESGEPALEARLRGLRERGWAVAVHNDYRLDGRDHTFWLFTRNGMCAKGEGLTDAEALDQVEAGVRRAERDIGLEREALRWAAKQECKPENCGEQCLCPPCCARAVLDEAP